MHLTPFGGFKLENYRMVPYQHHQSKLTWKVLVTKINTKTEAPSQEHTVVFARTAQEAAWMAIKAFEDIIAAKELALRLDAERKKSKKILPNPQEEKI